MSFEVSGGEAEPERSSSERDLGGDYSGYYEVVGFLLEIHAVKLDPNDLTRRQLDLFRRWANRVLIRHPGLDGAMRPVRHLVR